MISISLSTGGACFVGEQSGVNDFDNNILIIMLIIIIIMISKLLESQAECVVPLGILVIYPRKHDFVRSNDQNGQKLCRHDEDTENAKIPGSEEPGIVV